MSFGHVKGTRLYKLLTLEVCRSV